MGHALYVKHLSKRFGALPVINDISLKVKKHEFVTIIGRSGCGKSTLFHILTGIEKATVGEIIREQKKLKNKNAYFGYMPQEVSLLPWKTVLENVMLGPLLSGTGEEESKEKALRLLHKFSLDDFSSHYPSALSGGMQQRVALLRTVLFNPSFLLLDEPFGSLDALTRQVAQLWLLDVWKTYQSSVLFVTHDIREAILLSDKIYVFKKRPSEIAAEVSVNLPRPRKLTDLTSPEAAELERRLLSLLVNV